MKYIQYTLQTLFTLLFAATATLGQQQVEKSVAYHQGQQIVFDLPIADSIKISGWDRNEVALIAQVSINNNRLNDAYMLEVKESSELLKFEASFDEERLKEGRPGDCEGSSNYQTHNNGVRVVSCMDIVYELKVPRQAEISLNTISGNVEVKGVAGPSQIKTISGFIDFSWPQNQDANLQLKSITGELYTDLNFDILNRQDAPPIVGYTLKGKNGKGGPLLELETISSNIYLRRQ